MDYITPTELQRTIDLQDMDRYLGEGKDVITTNITDSKIYPNDNIKSYGHIGEVGTDSLHFKGENSHPALNNALEDRDSIHNIYLDGIDGEILQLFIHCSDPGIAKKPGKGNEIDFTPTLHNNERVISIYEVKHIVDDKEEDIAQNYSKITNLIHSSYLTNVGRKLNQRLI